MSFHAILKISHNLETAHFFVGFGRKKNPSFFCHSLEGTSTGDGQHYLLAPEVGLWEFGWCGWFPRLPDSPRCNCKERASI